MLIGNAVCVHTRLKFYFKFISNFFVYKNFGGIISEAALLPIAKMEDHLKEVLRTKVIKRFYRSRGGCISSGHGYETDRGRVFVKSNSKPMADVMFGGEFHGLKNIGHTKTVKVPEPILTGKINSEHFIIMEYCDISSLNRRSSELGRCLAELHLHNIELLENSCNSIGQSDNAPTDKFGFHVTTCCGYLQQNNEWCNDWVQFYASQRLLPQIRMIEREKNCREIGELWSHLQLKIPSFFKDVKVKPSLLHGDLWVGNVGETNEGAIIFDPATFYGHHEYDLAIAGMFGGFDRKFYDNYHSLIPKANGFEKRQYLYQLFHQLNHWNHFGSAYKSSTLSIMKDLLNQNS